MWSDSMPRNGSGVFSLPVSSSFNPAVTSQSATAPDWNALAADLAAALSQSVSQDGQTPITGNTPWANFRITNLGNPVNAQDAVTQTFLASFGGSYLRGLTLSNDSGTPNSVLDIAAGSCADSTNAVPIIGTAFTKSTAGSWTAGTGNNGMGAGLTITASTWYHVFPIINNGVYDVYFDTSLTAANKPAATTAFRRAGSFKTDGSAHIIAFTQIGDLFQWATPTLDYNANPGSSSSTNITVNTPPGVQCMAQIHLFGNAGNSWGADLTTPGQTSSGFLLGATGNGSNGQAATFASIMTDTTPRVVLTCGPTVGGVAFSLYTYGWIDRRGRDA
jgi:hypothetical protein